MAGTAVNAENAKHGALKGHAPVHPTKQPSSKLGCTVWGAELTCHASESSLYFSSLGRSPARSRCRAASIATLESVLDRPVALRAASPCSPTSLRSTAVRAVQNALFLHNGRAAMQL